MTVIKTPDQKLRVFISSTMEELAAERKAVRDGILKLHLTPVLFELGARPHPPKNLYKAYLEQSQVFVGIYWNSYGWIAPDMSISGLEDEYLLSGNKPKLIYIKQPASARDTRLEKMISEIQRSESVSYHKFSTPEELAELLENDLALLLSEGFHTEEEPNPNSAKKRKSSLPLFRGVFIGREKELESLQNLMDQDELALVTITGPGGTGKTTLALQTANRIKDKFKDGAFFVSLAAISDSGLVAAGIANQLGLYDSGRQSINETLLDYLQDKATLLVLDNFEQILEAGLLVKKIIDQCQSLKIMVTSRTPLHIRGEYLFPLDQLARPDIHCSYTPEEILEFPAIKLFTHRALEINSNFQASAENLEAVSAICHKLDGLPLAIELAAARTRTVQPIMLLKKMESTLNFLNQGPRDLPARQQTLRSTIEWSYMLLDKDTQTYFSRLSVFNDGWTSLAAELVVFDKDAAELDSLGLHERLNDFSLINTIVPGAKSSSKTIDLPAEPRFTMLQTIKEFALEKLAAGGEEAAIRSRHANYFVEFLLETEPQCWQLDPIKALNRIEADYQNIQSAFNYSLQTGNVENIWKIYGSMGTYWVAKGRFSEAADWFHKARINIDSVTGEYATRIDPYTFAKAFFAAGAVYAYTGQLESSATFLRASARIFEASDASQSLASVYTYLGIILISLGDPAAKEYLLKAIDLGFKTGAKMAVISGLTFLAEACTTTGDFQKAQEYLEKVEELSKEWGSAFGLGMASFQRANLYYYEGEFAKAADGYLEGQRQFEVASYNLIYGWAFIGLGSCMTELGQHEKAFEYLSIGLNKARELGEKAMMLVAITAFISHACLTGNKIKAARLMGAVENLGKQFVGHNTWNSNRKSFELAKIALEKATEKAEREREIEIGKSLSLEQAIALATS